MNLEKDVHFRIARIGKPHGIRGEVTVELFTDSPEKRFIEGNVFSIRAGTSSSTAFDQLTVQRARWNKNIMISKFVEVADRNTAESLRNCELYADLDDVFDGEGGWYADDLIGLSVHLDKMTNNEIGEVSGLTIGDAQDLLQVLLSDGRKVLLPFVEEIVPVIDAERGAIVITPPPGLLELNQD